MTSVGKLIVTPTILKMRAIADLRASGQAGGWALDLMAPSVAPPAHLVGAARRLFHELYEEDKDASLAGGWKTKTILPDWWLAARRIDKRAPNPTHLRFLLRFVKELGAHDWIEPIGAYYYVWKGKDRC